MRFDLFVLILSINIWCVLFQDRWGDGGGVFRSTVFPQWEFGKGAFWGNGAKFFPHFRAIICLPARSQWTYLHPFAINSTSKFQVERSLKLHSFWKANPLGNYDINRRGYFDVDSTFKIDEISMTSPRGFFYVVSMSNRHNFCTRCFHFIIS